MGGPYNIPRNYKGESKILFIFSIKAFIYSCIGMTIGLIFYFLCRALGNTILGIVFVAVFGLLGFAIGTFKVPENKKFDFMRKVGGENIDDIILRAVKFKKKNSRIYVYKGEENIDAK